MCHVVLTSPQLPPPLSPLSLSLQSVYGVAHTAGKLTGTVAGLANAAIRAVAVEDDEGDEANGAGTGTMVASKFGSDRVDGGDEGYSRMMKGAVSNIGKGLARPVQGAVDLDVKETAKSVVALPVALLGSVVAGTLGLAARGLEGIADWSIGRRNLGVRRVARFFDIDGVLIPYNVREARGHLFVLRLKLPALTGEMYLRHWTTGQELTMASGCGRKLVLLTTSQLMKLQDADFNFAPRGSSYMSWSERIDMLRAWKDANGHLKIPVNDPELGSFVKAQREAHRRRMIGDTTAMTDERYNDLLELGFVFEAGKRHTVPRGPTKTWEERFQDLMAYRDEYGHCSVPQHYPGLGYWVHAQRNGYRMLREGKKTAMTAEKALKLADASFIFDAKKGKRARASEGGGHGGDHHAGAGGGGGNMMNAAAGMAMGAAHGHHHANPPPLGGHLAPHQWAGHHY